MAAKKSSSEILNELFGTFNTSFDETEANEPDSDSSVTHSKSKKKKKHRDKDKESRKKAKRSKNKESPPTTPTPVVSQRKSKSKRKGDDGDEAEGQGQRKRSKASSLSSSSSLHFKGNTIKLDIIEEGEITEESERKAEKKRRREMERKAAEAFKASVGKQSRRSHSIDEQQMEGAHHSRKRHQSRTESTYYEDSQSDISYRNDNERYREKESSSRRRNESVRRSRSGSPASSSSYARSSGSSRRESHSTNYKDFNWEKARESSSYDKSYYSQAPVRRSSDYNYEAEKKYSGSRGGLGFGGSSSRYEDEYYDYRRSNANNSAYRGRLDSRRRSRSRSRSRSKLRRLHPDDIIDKSTLLEIARANAAKLMKRGVLPSDIFSRDQILAIKAGGKSVEELTEYCKKVAKRDAMGDADDGKHSSDEEERLIHHPFVVKDRPMPSITMNIRNAIPLPVRSSHELAIENAKLKVQFPVSSGTQHRYKEIEWKPVEKEEGKAEDGSTSKELVPLNAPKVGTVSPMPREPDEATSVSTSAAPLAITDGEAKAEAVSSETSVSALASITYDPKPISQVDIGSVISKRLRAMRELQDNPDSVTAKENLETATIEMREWAEAKALEPKFLTPSEIQGGPQAWAKKDQLKTASAVKSPMGMHLLQRMGWKPGEGLGKNKEGSTEPLSLDVKMDKKGLTGDADKKGGGGPSMPTVFDLSGKHPVSSLMELCAKRRWGSPAFEMCFEHGPPHKKMFVYKVVVNGVEYQPCVATNNKKEAKANCAAFCLQSLGLLPTPKPDTQTPAPPAHLLQTVPSASTIPASSNNIQSSVPVPVPHPSGTLQPDVFQKPAIPHMRPNPRMSFPSSTPSVPSHAKFCNPRSTTTSSALRPMMGSTNSNSNYRPAGIPRLMSEPDGPFIDPPIIQVPLPPPTEHGLPGLTTF